MKIKTLLHELLNTFSTKPSFFSRKRIESMLLFVSALGMAHVWFWTHFSTLDVTEVLMMVGTLLAYAGYTMHVIEKAKAKSQDEPLDDVKTE